MDIERIFSRQYKRMESELLGIGMPEGYLAIISKYWHFAEKDILALEENGDAMDKDSNKHTDK